MLLTFFLLLIVYTLFIVLEYFIYFSADIRKFIFFGFVFFGSLLSIQFIFSPLLKLVHILKPFSIKRGAELIQGHFGDIKDKLLNIIELAKVDEENYSKEIVAASIDQKIKELDIFEKQLAEFRMLPKRFVHDAILKMPSKDIMNAMSRSVLALYTLDENPEDISIENILMQSMRLIAVFPPLSVYAYQAFIHHFEGRSLVIHHPDPELSTAENILHMLRPDSKYSELEAKLLDLALVLHAEHGGGNNSSFTTHVVSSSGTDTYGTIAAALGSLKGPRHGGANIKAVRMFEDMKQEIKDWNDDQEIERYLARLLNKEAFDRSGLIYGVGHAVYSVSDPRTLILREYAEKLAKEKGVEDEFRLHEKVEKLAPEVIGKTRKIYKGVSANVDFYSGFVYKMMDIPPELFTPLFAIARIAGWSAHRIEEIANGGKIIRPAYKSVASRRDYVCLDDR